MTLLRKLNSSTLSTALMRMNHRVFYAAILGDFLFVSVFWFAPAGLWGTPRFYFSLGVLLEVTLVSALLIAFGWNVLRSRLGIFGWRMIFGSHATLYSLTWGLACAEMLAELKMAPYSISVTTTALAACTVAVSCFSFDIIVCLCFLASILGPLLWVSFLTLVDGQGLAGACTLSITFFAYLAVFIHKAEVDVLLHQDTIRAQAAALKISNDELTASNNLVRDTLDSVDEVFLILGMDGVCFGNPSGRAQAVLGFDPLGRHLCDVLKMEGEVRQSTLNWLEIITSDRIEFSNLSPLGPSEYVDQGKGLTYRIRFFPMRTKDKLTAVIMTMLDVTENLQAERAAEESEARANFILNVSQDRQAFAGLVDEVFAYFEGLQREFPADTVKLRHELHNLKGGAAMFNIRSLVRDIDTLEVRLSRAAVGEQAEVTRRLSGDILSGFREWLRHETRTLDRLRVFAAEEISISQSALRAFREETKADPGSLLFLDQALEKLRSPPLETVLKGFDSHVQSLAERLGKKVQLRIQSSSEVCHILSESYMAIMRQLVHLLNNAMDHGLEVPSDRVRLGKPEVGLIQMSYHRTPSEILTLEIKDDGRGIDPQEVRGALQARGQYVEGEPDQRTIHRIFDLGVSTAEETTDISGQGVGLNSLQALIVENGGEIDVESVVGEGTTFRIRLPAPVSAVWFEKPAA